MPVTQPVSEMITTARLLINQVSVHEAAKLQRLEATILIDLRDVRELQKMGVVPQAFHAQRGMLEFWAEPDSTITSPSSAPARSWCCSMLSACVRLWRPAPFRNMGMDNVLDMEGGFT